MPTPPLRSGSHSGNVGKTVLALMALGTGSALFGALVVGPSLGKQLSPGASADSSRRVQAPLPSEAAPSDTTAPAPSDDSESDDAERTAPPAPRADARETAARQGQTPPDSSPEPSGRTVHRHSPAPTVTVQEGDDAEIDPAKVAQAAKEQIAEAQDTPSARRLRRRLRSSRLKETAAEPARDPAPSGAAEADADATPPRREASAARKSSPLPDPFLYRVWVGRFASRDAADRAKDSVARAVGQEVYPIAVGDQFRLQVGAFRKRTSADRLAEQLRSRAYTVELHGGGAAADQSTKKDDAPAAR